jgi:hypothetical protein
MPRILWELIIDYCLLTITDTVAGRWWISQKIEVRRQKLFLTRRHGDAKDDRQEAWGTRQEKRINLTRFTGFYSSRKESKDGMECVSPNGRPRVAAPTTRLVGAGERHQKTAWVRVATEPMRRENNVQYQAADLLIQLWTHTIIDVVTFQPV